MDAEIKGALDSMDQVELHGSASINLTHDHITKTIDSLAEAAFERDPKMQELTKAWFHFRTPVQKAAAVTASALNYGILTRGDMPSSEGGDVILDEKLKIKSRGSAEYARQRQTDSINLKVTSAVMEICMGIGTKDPGRADKLVSSGRTALAKLVGDEKAETAVSDLKHWSSTLNLPENVYSQDAWDIDEHQNRLNATVQNAMDNDEVIVQIKRLVQKYNHHSMLYRVSSRVMNVGLSVAGLSPTMMGPAAQVALLAYIMATGGPEEDKLMNELNFDKRLQSRFDLITAKSQMALDKYEVAVLTKNPMLLVCSQSVIRQMTSQELTGQVFAADFTVPAPFTTQAAAEQANDADHPQSLLRSMAHKLMPQRGAQSDASANGNFAIPALPALAADQGV
jgi:hypothetical protein